MFHKKIDAEAGRGAVAATFAPAGHDMLCKGCDAVLPFAEAECPNCEEAPGGYAWERGRAPAYATGAIHAAAALSAAADRFAVSRREIDEQADRMRADMNARSAAYFARRDAERIAR